MSAAVNNLDAATQLRAAALDSASYVYQPEGVLTPEAAAFEVVEIARVFEVFLRGDGPASDEPEKGEAPAEEPPPCNCSMCAQRQKAETFQRIAAAARRLGKPADPPTDRANPLGTLAGLILGGETVDDHLSRCADCRTLVKAAGGLVPPWLGGRSGG